MTAATVYMAFAVWQAYLFAKSGSGLALALAVAVLALPLIGLWLVWREIAFASRVQRLADGLAARGQLPPELPRTPRRTRGARGGRAGVHPLRGTLSRTRRTRRRPGLRWHGRMRLVAIASARAAMRHAVALDDGKAGPAPTNLAEPG